MDTPAYLVPGICKWLLILPILIRLYTSVIPLDPEKWVNEESCPTDMSPTAIFYRCSRLLRVAARVPGGGRGVPGVWDRGTGREGREGYTGTHPVPVPVPVSEANLAPGPYLRPNEGKTEYIDEVSKMGPEWV